MQPRRDILELLALQANLIVQVVVLLLKLLVLVSLLWVQIIEPCLIREVDVIDLLLVGVQFVLHVTFLGEKSVKMSSLLVVLVFYVEVEGLDIFRLSVTSVLVQGQVVVGEVTLKLAHILDQSLILAL